MFGIIGVLAILLLLAAGVVLFVLAIAEMVSFSKENPKMLSTAKRAAKMAPLGFGWLIGLIVFRTAILPKVSADPEAESEVRKSFSSGFAWSVGLVALLILLPLTIAGLAISNDDGGKSADEGFLGKSPSSGNYSELRGDGYSTGEFSKIHEEAGIFSAKMPCRDIEREDSDLEGGRMFSVQCAEDSLTQTGMVSYAENEALDAVDEDLLDQVLDGMSSSLAGSGSFGGATDVKVLTQGSGEFLGNSSREAVLEAQFNGKEARVYWRGFFAKTSRGVKLFQIIGIGAGEDLEKALYNYEMISNDFRIIEE